MTFITFLISLVITGLLVGALGRLAIPGPNPMSIAVTIGVGLAGAFIGGFIAFVIGARVFVAFILEILVAAGIVYLMQRRRPRAI
jgi:uncharacterized membrane protein YeaQ/YmgE (transglycosylase-associated protein family)